MGTLSSTLVFLAPKEVKNLAEVLLADDFLMPDWNGVEACICLDHFNYGVVKHGPEAALSGPTNPHTLVVLLAIHSSRCYSFFAG